jgi:hypothetical protein
MDFEGRFSTVRSLSDSVSLRVILSGAKDLFPRAMTIQKQPLDRTVDPLLRSG